MKRKKDYCGKESPIGWVILNPEWPRGIETHLRQCNGCINCDPENFLDKDIIVT